MNDEKLTELNDAIKAIMSSGDVDQMANLLRFSKKDRLTEQLRESFLTRGIDVASIRVLACLGEMFINVKLLDGTSLSEYKLADPSYGDMTEDAECVEATVDAILQNAMLKKVGDL